MAALIRLLTATAIAFYGLCLVPPSHRLLWPSRCFVLLFALIIPFRQLATSGPEFGMMIVTRKTATIFPAGIGMSMWNAWKIHRQFTERSRIAVGVEARSQTPPVREITVLVVGESARYGSFQINGAQRETSPHLAGNKNLISFSNVSAPATVTLMSVPVLLTPATAGNLLHAPSLPSVINVCRSAGYYTAWYSTQIKHGAFDTSCSIFSRDAHEQKFLSGDFAPGAGTYASAHDGALLQPVRELVAGGRPRLFIVLHTMGSHQHYADRYPPEFDCFKSHGARVHGDVFPPKYDPELARGLTNAYDNTILYTDWFLSELINILSEARAVASLCYVSDHGQNTGDSKIMPFGHGSATPDVVQVPLLVWLSDEYRELRKEKVTALESHRHFPAGADSTFHTLLDMADIDCNLIDRTRSLASKEFQPRKRLFRNLEGVLLDADDILRDRKRSVDPVDK